MRGYSRARGGREDSVPAPTVKFGLSGRLELSFSGDYGLGNRGSANKCSFAPGLTGRPADQAGWRPAVSLSLGAAVPFGPGRPGILASWRRDIGSRHHTDIRCEFAENLIVMEYPRRRTLR